MSKKFIMVSHKELSDAFNNFAKKNGFIVSLYPDLKKKLFTPFGPHKTAGKKKVSVTTLYNAATKACEGAKRNSIFDAPTFNTHKYYIALDILDSVPRINAFNAACRKEAAERREKESRQAAARTEKRRNSPRGRLEARVETLERENAALRAQRRTPEQEQAERDAWAQSDTRIGGSPPVTRRIGLRD